MKKYSKNSMYLLLTMTMLLLSGVVIQLPSYKDKENNHKMGYKNIDISQRVQSLTYTGDVSAIAQGLSRYFIGSVDEALKEFLALDQVSLSVREKEDVLFNVIQLLRNRPVDQESACNALFDYHKKAIQEPLLYTAVTSSASGAVKDIMRFITKSKNHLSDEMIYNACNFAISHDDLKSVETLYLHGIMPNQTHASQLLKRIVCENKSINLAQFFIERAHAHLHCIDDHNKSLIAHAISHNKKGTLQTLFPHESIFKKTCFS